MNFGGGSWSGSLGNAGTCCPRCTTSTTSSATSPEHALQTAAWHLRVPASEVYGAATSYTELRVEAPAEHTVRICTGLSCLLNGAGLVLEAAREAAAAVETTAVEERACAFLCAAAPVVEIDHEKRGRVSPESVRGAVAASAGTAS